MKPIMKVPAQQDHACYFIQSGGSGCIYYGKDGERMGMKDTSVKIVALGKNENEEDCQVIFYADGGMAIESTQGDAKAHRQEEVQLTAEQCELMFSAWMESIRLNFINRDRAEERK